MKKIDFDKEWCVEHVDGAPFFTLPMALGFPTSFLPQFEYDFSMCYYKDMVLDYCTHVEMQMKITNAIIAKHLEDGKYFEKLIAKWNLGLVDLRRKYDDLMALDLGTLGDEELVKVYTDFFEYLTFKLYFPGLLDAFMFGADKLLFEKLGKYCSNVQEVFEVLTKPVNESFLKEYNDELIEIKKDISLIDKHIAKYRWINSNYCGSKPYCKDEVLNAIKGDLSSN